MSGRLPFRPLVGEGESAPPLRLAGYARRIRAPDTRAGYARGDVPRLVALALARPRHLRWRGSSARWRTSYRIPRSAPVSRSRSPRSAALLRRQGPAREREGARRGHAARRGNGRRTGPAREQTQSSWESTETRKRAVAAPARAPPPPGACASGSRRRG